MGIPPKGHQMDRTLALLVMVALAGPAAAQEAAPAPATPAWKPFQEFGFVLGSYSGTVDSGGRVGGTVSRWSLEMNGNFLVHRVNMIIPAQEGKPEESLELLGTYAYDREARRYSASYYFSTGLAGIFDVEVLPDGSVRLVSSKLLNYDAGARARLVVTKKPDGSHDFSLDLALAGKEFAPYLTSHLTKK